MTRTYLQNRNRLTDTEQTCGCQGGRGEGERREGMKTRMNKGAVVDEEEGKDAKENAYNKDNVMLAVKIGSFIDKYADELATPEELKESRYAEAEEFIQRGMAAKKGDE